MNSDGKTWYLYPGRGLLELAGCYLDASLIEMHPNNMNREHGLILSNAWKPLLHTLKEKRDNHTIHNNPTAP